MSGSDRYLVPGRDVVTEIEVKRSRFRCDLRRVEDEAAARAVVEECRRGFWDARHHCSAFVLGPDGAVQRSSDDGEPSGTAGMPMLEVLRGAGVSDVVAVVTRWFGGTLLGSGGLVRAYSDAVRVALEEAGTAERRLQQVFRTVLGHADAGRIEEELRRRDLQVLDVAYGSGVDLTFAVAPEQVQSVPGLLAELSGGAAKAEAVDTRWVES